MHSNDNRFSTVLFLVVEAKIDEIGEFSYIDKIIFCTRIHHCAAFVSILILSL